MQYLSANPKSIASAPMVLFWLEFRGNRVPARLDKVRLFELSSASHTQGEAITLEG